MANVVALGEILLRLSTFQGKLLSQSSVLEAGYGGGEANVAISLSNFGYDVSFASKIPSNSLGTAVIQHLKKFGVNTQFCKIGGSRLGSYYLETGISQRGSKVIYDRAYSSFAEVTENEWKADAIFNKAQWFHISGITPALSPTWQNLTLELVQAAKKCGCLINFDINFRNKLWTQAEAKVFLKQLLPLIDSCSAGALDAKYLMDIPFTKPDNSNSLKYFYEALHQKYPNIKTIYATERISHSATNNDLIGKLWHQGNYYESKRYSVEVIVDRVGEGDAFTAGILHGLFSEYSGEKMIEFATAATALKHTVCGDQNLFDVDDVLALIYQETNQIQR